MITRNRRIWAVSEDRRATSSKRASLNQLGVLFALFLKRKIRRFDDRIEPS
jgi:hypothetical protein